MISARNSSAVASCLKCTGLFGSPSIFVAVSFECRKGGLSQNQCERERTLPESSASVLLTLGRKQCHRQAKRLSGTGKIFPLART